MALTARVLVWCIERTSVKTKREMIEALKEIVRDDLGSMPLYDPLGNFLGREPRECGDHRTVGSHRAWCFTDQEWCYPSAPCRGCE